MKEKDSGKQCGISRGKTIDEIAEYWDTHSLADHWARTRGVSTETLVNLWLVERLRTEKAAVI